ncbi:NrpR regulatory domain-containing protein [Chloroflexota bacterium]
MNRPYLATQGGSNVRKLRIGMVLLGGLNPAAAVETGIEIENIAESGMVDFQQMASIW